MVYKLQVRESSGYGRYGEWQDVIALGARHPYTYDYKDEAAIMLRTCYPDAFKGEVRIAPADTVATPWRNLFAFILKYDSGNLRSMLRILRRLGCRNLAPDYILFRKVDGTYDRTDDPGAWNGVCRGNLSVCLIRRQDGDKVEWTLHS
jgi:hypothetical protein